MKRSRFQALSFSLLLFLLLLLLLLLYPELNLSVLLHSTRDGMALLRFRERVDLDPYRALSVWENGEMGVRPCFWFGVECSDDGRVIALNVENTIMRRFLQLYSKGKRRNNISRKNQSSSPASQAPTPSPSPSHMPLKKGMPPSVPPFLSPFHPSGISPSLSAAPQISSPTSSTGQFPAPGLSPSAMTEPPSLVPSNHPKFAAIPPSTSVPFPFSSGRLSPSGATGIEVKHKHYLLENVWVNSFGGLLYPCLIFNNHTLLSSQ